MRFTGFYSAKSRHGMVDQRADVLGQVVVDPGRDVGGEGERLAVGAHVAGGGDADGLDIGVSGGHSLAVHLGDVLVDGVGTDRRTFCRGRRSSPRPPER